MGNVSPTAMGNDTVVREFHEALARSSDMAVAVAAIHSLTTVIRTSTASTMMGLERELKEAAASLQRCNPTAISLKTGCELFLRYTTRTSAVENDTFDVAKKKLIERGRHFAGRDVFVCGGGALVFFWCPDASPPALSHPTPCSLMQRLPSGPGPP